jgi:DNA-binding XRE family transcriptional regulator
MLHEISKESILKAEKLSKYFIAMAKKIKIDSVEKFELKKVIKLNEFKTNKEKFKALYSDNKDLNRKEVSEILGVSRKTIQLYIKEIENGK